MTVALSSRILSVKSSPTVALNAKAKALGKDGIKVYNFAVGEPDFPTPASVVEVATKALAAGRTKYGPAGGSPEFRQAIADKLARENQVNFKPDEIVVGIGAKEILFHICLATINEGDEVIIPAPYWVSYPDQVIAAGGKPVCLDLPRNIALKPIEIEMLRRAATPRTTAIILNSPNNPAGYVFDEAQMRELGTFLRDKPWWIISDEIYEYLAFDRPHVSLLKMFPELADRFILVNGMSKGYAMTGWRVGYCAGPARAMKLVRDLQSHSSTCLPPFIEDAATFAIKQGPSLLADGLKAMQRRRDLAAEILRDAGIGFVAPQGAFYVFIDTGRKDSMALGEQLLMKHHVAMVPGEAFGAPGYLRMSYATDERTIEDGLKRLVSALRES